jgi:hypothetical protein
MRTGERWILGDGLILGLLGFVALAVTFAGWNVLTGRYVLETGVMIGSLLFYGGTVPASAPPVLIAGAAVHLLGFILIGVLIAASASLAIRVPRGWYPLIVAFAFVFLHLLALPFIVGPGEAPLPLAGVLAAASAAALVMAFYLVHTHPELIRRAGEADPAD